MSSFPLRKENTVFAEIKLRHRSNDLFLFIEDEKSPHVYKKLISRLFDNKIKIGKVYPLKSKKNVIDKFHEWKEKDSRLNKCFFIVDKDFDYFKGEFVPVHSNLIELEYYTLENYLVTEEGAISLLETKFVEKEHEELKELLDWENWLGCTYQDFKNLFIVYAIAHKYDLERNTSESPYKYLIKNNYKVDLAQIDSYISKIKDICSSRHDINFEEEFNNIDNYFRGENGYRFDSLIKGKYIFAAMFKYLHHLTGKKFDADLAIIIIAENITLGKLEFLRRKLIAV